LIQIIVQPFGKLEDDFLFSLPYRFLKRWTNLVGAIIKYRIDLAGGASLGGCGRFEIFRFRTYGKGIDYFQAVAALRFF
jgi:hypothetical protein